MNRILLALLCVLSSLCKMKMCLRMVVDTNDRDFTCTSMCTCQAPGCGMKMCLRIADTNDWEGRGEELTDRGH